MTQPKTFSIINLGCPKNQVDAEVMLGRLQDAGWEWQAEPSDPSLLIINTCGFIESAQQESIDALLAAVNEYPNSHVIAAGCLTQRYAQELADEIPELSAIFGNRSPHRILELVEMAVDRDDPPVPAGPSPRAADVPGGAGPIVFTPAGTEDLESPGRGQLLSGASTAYLKVAEGCDHTCTFCAIPSIRGGKRERPSDEIVQEAATLVGRGIKEITLVAQDLAAYSRPDLVSLVREILTVPGEYWLRPLYLYPDNFPVELAALTVSDRRVLPYFDISFQHADSRILKRMGRRGSSEAYLDLIGRIRDKNPDTALRTSLIVGFPGESDKTVQTLMDFLDQAQLDWVGVFSFSPQEGTPAAAWVERGEMAPEAQVRQWKQKVEEHQERITRNRLARHVGSTVDVLVEEAIAGSALYLCRGWMHAPEVDGLAVLSAAENRYVPGQMVRATVTAVNGIDLAVRPVRH